MSTNPRDMKEILSAQLRRTQESVNETITLLEMATATFDVITEGALNESSYDAMIATHRYLLQQARIEARRAFDNTDDMSDVPF